jgi:hypothetical protein
LGTGKTVAQETEEREGKMIAKILPHKSPYRLLKYMQAKPGFITIDSTMFSSPSDTKGMAQEFRDRFETNKRGKNKFVHVVWSLHKDDVAGMEAWQEHCAETAKVYGADMYFAGMHTDREHVHCHQAICLVKANGKMCDTSNERRKLRNLATSFEKKFGTTETKNRNKIPLLATEVEPARDMVVEEIQPRVSQQEIERANRLYHEGKQPMPTVPKLDLRAELDVILRSSQSFDDLEQSCGSAGISVRFRTNDQGKRCGVSFCRGNNKFTGTQLGISYKQLKQRYNNGQDNEIERTTTIEPISCRIPGVGEITNGATGGASPAIRKTNGRTAGATCPATIGATGNQTKRDETNSTKYGRFGNRNSLRCDEETENSTRYYKKQGDHIMNIFSGLLDCRGYTTSSIAKLFVSILAWGLRDTDQRKNRGGFDL